MSTKHLFLGVSAAVLAVAGAFASKAKSTHHNAATKGNCGNVVNINATTVQQTPFTKYLHGSSNTYFTVTASSNCGKTLYHTGN